MINIDRQINRFDKRLAKKDKEIERLKKEKEWLITQLCKDWDQDAHGTEKEDLKGFINKQMQQALKEGE